METIVIDALKTGGTAAVLLALVVALGWKFGGQGVDAIKSYLSDSIAEQRASRLEFGTELRRHRDEENENHREQLTAWRETTKALTEMSERIAIVETRREDDDDDYTPVGGGPRRRVGNGQRRR